LTILEPDGKINQLFSAPAFHVDVSADGESILFASPKEGDFSIYLTDREGSVPRRLTQPGARQTHPRWIPSSKNFIYVSDEGGLPELFLYNLTTGRSQKMMGLPSPAGWPSVSKDGRYLAFSAAPSGDWDIFIVELDDEVPVVDTLKLLVANPGFDISPEWSPDGNQLVYTFNQDMSLSLYVFDLDTMENVKLWTSLGNEWYPRWTYQDLLLFQSYVNGSLKILTMNVNTGDIRVLPGAPQDAAWPAIFPVQVQP
jgi:TolB protein